VLQDLEELWCVPDLELLRRLEVGQGDGLRDGNPGLRRRLVGRAQHLVRHVRQERGEVRCRVHAGAGGHAECGSGTLHLAHARDSDTLRAEEDLGDVEQAHPAVLTGLVVELEHRGGQPVEQRALDAVSLVDQGIVSDDHDVAAARDPTRPTVVASPLGQLLKDARLAVDQGDPVGDELVGVGLGQPGGATGHREPLTPRTFRRCG